MKSKIHLIPNLLQFILAGFQNLNCRRGAIGALLDIHLAEIAEISLLYVAR